MLACLTTCLSPRAPVPAPDRCCRRYHPATLPPCVCRYAKSLDASKFSRPSAPQLAGSSGGGGGKAGQAGKAGKDKEGEPGRVLCVLGCPSASQLPRLALAGSLHALCLPHTLNSPLPCALLTGGREAKGGGAKKQQQSGKAEQIILKNLVS